MIHYDGYDVGELVRFQDSNFVWKQGTVVKVEWAEHRHKGPNGSYIETKPSRVHIRFFDSVTGADRVAIFPKKRVRAWNPSKTTSPA